MWVLLQKLWNDPDYFMTAVRTLLGFLGVAFHEGYLPTGIDGGGKWIGLLMLLAIPALKVGQSNVVKVTDTGQIVPVTKP